MNFDLRIPIGLMFSIYGVLLTGYGLLGDKAIYQRSLGININMVWGLVLLAFGLGMLFLARKSFCSKCSDSACDAKLQDKKAASQQAPKA